MLQRISTLLLVLCLFLSEISAQELTTTSLLDGKATLQIPNDFTLMDEETKKLKYPHERRPTIVYTNEKTTTNVAINYTAHPASEKELAQYQKTFLETFRNLYPSADWKGEGFKVINNKKVGYLELITPAIDTKIYNLIFFTNVDGRLAMFTFNSTDAEMKQWEETAHRIMQSLVVNK